MTLSAVTVTEIVRGFQRNQSQRKLQNFLAAVALEEVLGLDRAAGELAGRIAGELERIGHPIGLADPMIAAIALTHGLELVTKSGNPVSVHHSCPERRKERRKVTLYINLVLTELYDEMLASCPPDLGGRPRRR